MQPLKIGSQSPEVRTLQIELNKLGYGLATDGIYGAKTAAAVTALQKKIESPATGELDAETHAFLFPDVLSCAKFVPLERGQYVHKPSNKIGVCLHHTASGGNPYRVGQVWNNDSRGRVAMHFVVGSDGTILQVMPLQCWGYHIAMFRENLAKKDLAINSGYIGIEICNWGYAEKVNGKFLTYVGGELSPSEVEHAPFRRLQYWHKYTDAQVAAVRKILAELKAKFGFKYESLPLDNSWLDLDPKAQQGQRVLTTHTNFERGKFDCSPTKNFFAMVE
jgi:N-acetyl-anhydromuramyl-L-alanine amidase AmpD